MAMAHGHGPGPGHGHGHGHGRSCPIVADMSETGQAIDTMLLEERRYPPPPEFAAQANAQPDIYDRDPLEFWADEARERVTWFEPFDTLYEWEPPYAKWFLGGKLNIAYNCLDRHVEAGRGDKVAYHWEGEPGDDRRDDHLRRPAARGRRSSRTRCKALGVKKGDAGRRSTWAWSRRRRSRCSPAPGSARRTPSSSAASRPSRSRDRLQDMGCEVLITQDEAWRRGTTVAAQADGRRGARRRARPSKHVLVLRRTGGDVPMTEGRDRLVARRRDRRVRLPARSRWTPRICSTCSTRRARPRSRRASLHTTGGYLVGVGDDPPLRLRPQARHDVYWCAADVGWVTGHSYIVYGPLCNGTTGVMYEGTPDFPDKDRWWEIVERYEVDDPLHRADGDPHAHEVGRRSSRSSTTSRRCGCSGRSASRSTPRRGSGTTSTSAAAAARSSTRGGRPRRG